MATILIVEDDPAVGRLLDLALAVDGHITELIDTGKGAVERLDGTPTDLVLLDIMLPGTNGFSVLQSLRERSGWDRTRVIVLTALDADADVWRGWANGTDYYLTKPFDLAQLRTVSERLLAGEDLSASRTA